MATGTGTETCSRTSKTTLCVVLVWTVLLVIEQPTIPLLPNNIPTFMKPNVPHSVRKHKDLIHILSKINLLNNFLLCFFEIHFNIMSPSVSTTFDWPPVRSFTRRIFVPSSLFQQTLQLQATSPSSCLSYDSLFQSEFPIQRDLVLLLSTSSIFSFP